MVVCAVAVAALWYLYQPRAEPAQPTAPAPVAPVDAELAQLRTRYGNALYSQYDEELFIRDFFGDRRGGVFVDVGASHYEINSTTYYLEKHLGWRGIAIDALEDYRQGYQRHRPGTKFFAYYVADHSGGISDFHIVRGNERLSTGLKEVASDKGSHETVALPTVSLTDLLQREGLETIDFLSIDIEQAEPTALRGLDIERFRPALVCIDVSQHRDAIYAYFRRHGYEELEHYTRLDPLNAYFRPAAE